MKKQCSRAPRKDFSRTLRLVAPGALAAVTLLAVSGAAAQRLPDARTIDGDPVVTLLPPNAIPAIDRPRFRSAEEARFMRDDELVVGVVHNGIAKAYSLWHLDQHEIVNDEFGDDPLAVTW